MDCAIRNRLIHVKVTVADLEVEATLGVRTNPGLVMDRGTLAAEIGQRDQVAGLAPLTSWKTTGNRKITGIQRTAPLTTLEIRASIPEHPRA